MEIVSGATVHRVASRTAFVQVVPAAAVQHIVARAALDQSSQSRGELPGLGTTTAGERKDGVTMSRALVPTNNATLPLLPGYPQNPIESREGLH